MEKLATAQREMTHMCGSNVFLSNMFLTTHGGQHKAVLLSLLCLVDRFGSMELGRFMSCRHGH